MTKVVEWKALLWNGNEWEVPNSGSAPAWLQHRQRRRRHCLAEVRMYEAIEGGAPATPFLHFGDRVAHRDARRQRPEHLWRYRPDRAPRAGTGLKGSGHASGSTPTSAVRRSTARIALAYQGAGVRIQCRAPAARWRRAAPERLLRSEPCRAGAALQDNGATITQSMAILEYSGRGCTPSLRCCRLLRWTGRACDAWRRRWPATFIR